MPPRPRIDRTKSKLDVLTSLLKECFLKRPPPADVMLSKASKLYAERCRINGHPDGSNSASSARTIAKWFYLFSETPTTSWRSYLAGIWRSSSFAHFAAAVKEEMKEKIESVLSTRIKNMLAEDLRRFRRWYRHGVVAKIPDHIIKMVRGLRSVRDEDVSAYADLLELRAKLLTVRKKYSSWIEHFAQYHALQQTAKSWKRLTPTTLRMASWNPGSASADSQLQVVQLMYDHHIDILALQEFKPDPRLLRPLQSFYRRNGPPGRRLGVSFVVRPDIKCTCVPFPAGDFDGCEVSWLLLHVAQFNIHFATVYKPPASNHQLGPFVDHIGTIDPDQPLLVMGDFNARIGFPTFGQTENARGAELRVAMDGLSLQCLNLDLPDCHTHHRHPATAKTIIDYAYLRTGNIPNEVVDEVQYIDVSPLGHRILSLSIRGFDMPIDEQLKGPIRFWKFKLLKDELAKVIDERSADVTPEELPDIIVQSAEDVLGRSNTSKRTIWWMPSLSSFVLKKNKIRDEYIRACPLRQARLLPQYRKACQDVRRAVRRAKRKSWSRLMKEIEADDIKGGQQKVWSIYRSMKGTHQTKPQVPVEKMTRFLSILWNPPPTANVADQPQPQPQVQLQLQAAVQQPQMQPWIQPLPQQPLDRVSLIADLVTIEELDCALADTGQGKASGMDSIQYEYLRSLMPAPKQKLLDLYNQVLVSKEWIWKESEVVSIFKKGDPLDPGNYRPISLGSHIGLLLEKIILRRFNSRVLTLCPIDPRQGGFRRGYGCTEHAFVLQQIQQEAQSRGSRLVAIFLDIRKAFDSVPRHVIQESIQRLPLDADSVRFIMSLVSGRTARVKGSDDVIECNTGVPQGGVLSPILFNIVMGGLIERLDQTNFGEDPILGLDEHLRILLFADDIVLPAGSDAVAQRKLTIVSRWLESKGLTPNPSKTKVVLMSKGKKYTAAVEPISLSGVVLEKVDTYKYLGIPFYGSKRGGVKADTTRLEKAIATLNALRGLLSSTFSLPTRIAARVFESCSISQALYGSELCLVPKFWTEKLLHAASYLILGTYHRTHIWERFAFLGWSPLHILGHRRILNFAVRIISHSQHTSPLVRAAWDTARRCNTKWYACLQDLMQQYNVDIPLDLARGLSQPYLEKIRSETGQRSLDWISAEAELKPSPYSTVLPTHTPQAGYRDLLVHYGGRSTTFSFMWRVNRFNPLDVETPSCYLCGSAACDVPHHLVACPHQDAVQLLASSRRDVEGVLRSRVSPAVWCSWVNLTTRNIPAVCYYHLLPLHRKLYQLRSRLRRGALAR